MWGVGCVLAEMLLKMQFIKEKEVATALEQFHNNGPQNFKIFAGASCYPMSPQKG